MAVALALAAAAGAASGYTSVRKCGTLTIRSAPYNVEVNGAVTCAFARLWAAKLAPLKGKVGSDGVLKIPGHPPGYTCGGTPYNDNSFPYQYQGGCRTLANTPKSFEWVLKDS